MHMSDGIVDAPTSLAYGLVAVAGLTVAVTLARRDLDERAAPLAGLVAAFVFAAQMVNFPVLPGVSGHLLGGALVAMLVGPWVGALCVAIVLVVQSLLFADGGLSALGTNITNIALVGVAAGYLVAVALRRVARAGRSGLVTVAFVSALVNVLAAAASFTVQYAIGGAGGIGIGELAAVVLGVHALIGIGEGVITALTVGAVGRVRPDLVYVLRPAAAVGRTAVGPVPA